MSKEEEHIIDYILRKTDLKITANYQHLRKGVKYEQRKYKLDDLIMFCNQCKQSWSQVPDWVDSSKYRMYPKGHMPTIGKKRKICPNCNKNT